MTESSGPSRNREPNLLSRLARRAWRRLRPEPDGAEAVVAAALDAEAQAGEPISSAQRELIMNAVRFYRLRVADVMAPRAAIVALDIESDLGAAARMFVESEHSRLPLYRETLDDPLGFVHVKDVLALLAPDEAGATKSLASDKVLPRLRRDILYVPASMRLPALLIKMQTSHIHLALVVDEYGGTDGIVSIEDVVEQVVGDIEDEHDETANMVQPRGPGLWEADARADIEDAERAIGASLSSDDEEREFDTLGGLVAALAGRVPQRGEVLRHPAGFDLEVLDADPRRAKRLRIRAVAVGDKSGA